MSLKLVSAPPLDDTVGGARLRLFALVCMEPTTLETTGLVFTEASSLDAALLKHQALGAITGLDIEALEPEPEALRFVRELPRDIVIDADVMLGHWHALRKGLAA